MSKHLKEHEQRKQLVLQLLDQAKHYEETFGEENKVSVFQELYKNVEDGTFSIVVVGEFSAGKSTFLNALMGEKILPSFTNETTATVNFLRGKSASPNGEVGRVHYKDGSVEVLETASQAVIEQYVSTRSNIEVAQQVESLEVFLDSKFLNEGVTLVDSPGLNGVAEGHREITESQIEKSHASIFMFSAEQPGKKTDFEFLGRLKHKVNTILLVLNKIDCIKASEGMTVEDVIGTLKESYKKQFPEDAQIPKIWPIAAYPALVARASTQLDYQGRMEATQEDKDYYEQKSRFKGFEERLWKFLTQGEKAKEELLAPVQRILAILKEEQEDLQKEKKLLENEQDEDELREQILAIEKEKSRIEDNIQQSTRGIGNQVKKIEKEVLQGIHAQIVDYSEKRLGELKYVETVEEMGNLLDNFGRKFDKQLLYIAQTVEKQFGEEIIDLIEENYEEYLGEIESRLNETGMNIQFKTDFNIEGKGFTVNLQKYELEIQELEKTLDRLQDKMDTTDIQIVKGNKLDTQKKYCENQLMLLKGRRDQYRENFMVKDVEYRTENAIEKESRGGLLGFATTILFGEKDVHVIKTHKDTTLRDASEKQKMETLNSYEDEIKEVRKHLEDVKKSTYDTQELELERKRLERKREQMEKVIEEKRNKLFMDVENQEKAEIRRLRRELENYMDEVADTFLEHIKKEVKAKRQEYTECIKNTMHTKLSHTLSLNEHQLKLLQGKLESSVEEKEKCLVQLEKRMQAAKDLMAQAIELELQLEEVEVDKIEQVEV